MGQIEELEAIEGSVKAWRPWKLQQFELVQGTTVSTPSTRHFILGYMLLSIQSGTADSRYRNIHASDQGGEGTFRVFEPEEIWICQPNNATFQCLTIDPTRLQEIATQMLQRERPLPHFPSHCLFDPSVSRAVHDFAASSMAPVSRLQQEEMLLNLFAPLLLFHAEDASTLPQLGWEHPAVKRTKAYLQAHYAEEVALQDLAAAANMSPFHLSRVFRQVVGVPPHAYQIQLRLARAKTLLAQGYDVGYAAHETGFFDQSHFSQQFRRHFFMTPGSYRKTARFS
jgi:AraC-like DNA-binding protein